MLLFFYASFASTLNLIYYLPGGLLIISWYIWVVVRNLKGIYPQTSRAIGQFCITFALTFFWCAALFYKKLIFIRQSNEEIVDDYIQYLALIKGIERIAMVSSIFLFLFYLIIKIRGKNK